jgi:hypothetical protein
MQFKVGSKTLPINGKGLLMVLTRAQAERRRHILKRVMPDGSKVSVLPALMRPAPELPELGTYALAGSCDFKAGEFIEFPKGYDVAGALGKEAMSELEPNDDEALDIATKAVAKPEKKPRPAHGGPVFRLGKAPVGAGVAAWDEKAKALEVKKVEATPAAPALAPAPVGPQSISKKK